MRGCGLKRDLIVGGLLVAVLVCGYGAESVGRRVDYRYAPPEWQVVISKPDAVDKSMVCKQGRLLYGFGQGSQGFSYQLGVEVATNCVWQGQRLHSARVPIVYTSFTNSVLEVRQTIFTITEEVALPRLERGGLQRVDAGSFVEQHLDGLPSRAAVAEQNNVVHYVAGGERCLVAVALHEGWWQEPGRRVVRLRVEGAPEVRVDCVSDIGYNKSGVFWFEGRDVNGDGVVEILAEPLADPQTIVSGIWIFGGDQEAERSFEVEADVLGRATSEMGGAVPRHIPAADAIHVRISNRSGEEQVVEPALKLFSRYKPEMGADRVVVESGAVVSGGMRLSGRVERKRGWHTIASEPFVLAAGATTNLFVIHGDAASGLHGLGVREVEGKIRDAAAYWEGVELPYNRIVVPDRRVRDLLESSVRNLWQMRDIKQGRAILQTGPTLYRGLWIVDGAFLAEAAAMLGCLDDARNAIEYMLGYQQSDGGIKVMKDFSKENGIMLYACYQHARMSQDRAWLEQRWGQLTRVAEYIKGLRVWERGREGALNYGLMPAGMPDGGQAAVLPEYSNNLWNLAGLKAFVEGARWLGREAEADTWQQEYEDFMGRFREAAERDSRRDQSGNLYLPNLMGSASRDDLPQRGLWSFCLAVHPGRVFEIGDEVALGTLSMLEGCERQGMVVGTGWHESGIWGYFASFYAHAWLWMGRGSKGADLLYAFANHAAPMLVWDEEHSLAGEAHKRIGDMPHVWANAEFIRLVVHLLALERGDELHLFEGLPEEWVASSGRVELNGVVTRFGPLTLSLERRGESVEVVVDATGCAGCRVVKLHRSAWNSEGAVMELEPGEVQRLTLPVSVGR